MSKSEREKALDLEAIRRIKHAQKRRKIILLVGVGVLLLILVGCLLLSQMGHVLDDSRGFWGNFGPLQSESSISSSQ